MSLTNIQVLASNVFGIQTFGNVYIVADTTSSAYAKISARYSSFFYEDGTAMLYPHTSTSTAVTTNGIKNALTACVTDRDDHVIVLPSSNTYYTDESLHITKKAVHIKAPAGLVCDVGCSNAVRLQQITDGEYIFSVENGGIEIAGFYMKNYDGHAHIYVPNSGSCTGAPWGISIHHNYFVGRSTGASEAMLYCVGDGASYSRIEKNWFTEQVSSATYAACISIASTSANTEITGNYITIGDGCTATVGILAAGVKDVVANNYITECGGKGSEPSGTVTAAVSITTDGTAINNMCAVGTTQALSGGTAAHSFVHNFDGNSTYSANTNLES